MVVEAVGFEEITKKNKWSQYNIHTTPALVVYYVV